MGFASAGTSIVTEPRSAEACFLSESEVAKARLPNDQRLTTAVLQDRQHSQMRYTSFQELRTTGEKNRSVLAESC